LWPAVLERTDHALTRGAIQSIPTTSEIIEHSGVRFQVRVITSLTRKADDKRTKPNANPFLPYDPDLFVADISPTHLALLNKFNVVEHHFLIVTRTFEEQEAPLVVEDFEALLACLAEIDGLGFYNAGMIAGASQRHKHLQLVPLAPTSSQPRIPIEPLLRSARVAALTSTVPGLPFLHAYAPMEPRWVEHPGEGALPLLERYLTMLEAVGLATRITPDRRQQPAPYNLLVTREWMLLVPRSVECFEGISINALGFAGALLVKDAQELEVLKMHGPMTALQAVTFARPA
jgi:ATP adenylyltransferase